MTVDLVLPRELANKVFGLYLFGTIDRADLSQFTERIFFDEIARRLQVLSLDEKRKMSTRLRKVLD